MSKQKQPEPEPQSKSKPYSQRRAIAVALLSSAVVTTGAVASTQPFENGNPFEANIPDMINSSGGGSSSSGIPDIGAGIAAGEPSIEDWGGLGDGLPSFPGLPDGEFPSSPDDIIDAGLGGIFGDAGGPAPSIFKDILNGNMGGILETIFGILVGQNEVFEEISEVVLGDGWETADGDGDSSTPPNPYEIRLPDEETDDETGLITRSPIVVRRDKANQYDQELGRAMAAPMLAEKGNEWLEGQITTSTDMMQAGLATTQSAVTKSGEATEATSTQEIVRRSAEISGMAATLQMQEMQQNALISESLWNMQRLESAQLQLAADTSEAADEQNRRDRASRTADLSAAAVEVLIIPGLAGSSSTSTAASTLPAAPAATSLFASP